MNNSARCINTDIFLQVQRCIEDAIPANTTIAYKADMRYVNGWLKCVFGKMVWPMTEEAVLQFILHHLSCMPKEIERELILRGIKKRPGILAQNTVRRRLTSISMAHVADGHEDPCKTDYVRSLLSALQKTSKVKEKKSKAITKEILHKMIDTCENHAEGIRDRALLLFAWCSGGRRRSEVSDAMVCDLHIQQDGSYIYHMPKSKTDQEGKGHEVPVKGLAAKAMKKWLAIAGIKKGRIFREMYKSGKLKDRILEYEVNRMVKKRVKMAGIDPKYFSSHGIRRGFVSEAGKQGVPLGDVMAMTGHRCVKIAMGYYEAGSLINNKAADLI